MDGHWRRTINRRSKEGLGLLLLISGAAMGMAVASYSASDPGMLTATENRPQNLLGLGGAAAVSPFMITLGNATWCLPAFLFVWGLRFLVHVGSERLIARFIYLPLMVLSASLVASILPRPTSWPHHFGAGGMLGDIMAGGLTYSWPANFGDGQTMSMYIALTGLALFSSLALGVTLSSFYRTPVWILTLLMRAFFLFFGLSRKRKEFEEQDLDKPQRRSVISFFRRKNAEVDEELVEFEDEFEEHKEFAEADADKAAENQRSPLNRIGHFPSLLFKGERRSGKAGRHGAKARRNRAEPSLFGTSKGLLPSNAAASEAGREPEKRRDSVVKHTKKRRRQKSTKAIEEAQPPLFTDPATAAFQGPPLSLLQDAVKSQNMAISSDALGENAKQLETVLKDYGVRGKIIGVRPGPVVTLYELLPEAGMKASRVMGLADDIARNMSALSARVSTMPGRNVIGIELPNERRETVFLRELLADREFGDSKMNLPIALGKDIGGEPVIDDLAGMPHLLIAGTTGSGKSVAINTMILSLLYRLPPDECKLIMIDPKMLELSVYDGIPHLLAPVVTDPKKAVVALKWVVAEMVERYRKMSKVNVRKLTSYNERVREAQRQGITLGRQVQTGFDENGDPVYVNENFDTEPLPYIVVIVDEMADLMMVAGKEIEACIQRLAQMGRASGIHVVMATQRPSVDVITGTIKANFPTRVSFQVTSKIDSRTILGEQGAEQLLGRGDMLHLSSGGSIGRVHGPFVTDEEVEEVVAYLKQFGEPEYVAEVLEHHDSPDILGLDGSEAKSSDNTEYDRAVSIVMRDRKCSTSYIQRKMSIGYNKAAILVERMEEEGLISAANHVGKRDILVPEQ